jgi:hypothetical protein
VCVCVSLNLRKLAINARFVLSVAAESSDAYGLTMV